MSGFLGLSFLKIKSRMGKSAFVLPVYITPSVMPLQSACKLVQMQLSASVTETFQTLLLFMKEET